MEINYKELYLLQDTVLFTIFKNEIEFYLTGGTCLNRFYYEERYSDDLDLFTNFSSTFHNSIQEVIDLISHIGCKVMKTVESKDFVRIQVSNNGVELQVDFINDRVKRFGKLEQINGVIVDSVINILSNKLTAIIGRDNPKDIFDIYLIAKHYSFNWGDVVKQAQEKSLFEINELVYRLETFPVEFIKILKVINLSFLNSFDNEFSIIIRDIYEENDNSLAF